MVNSSSFRDKLRSNGLKELARERGLKRTREERTREEDHADSDDDKDKDDDIDLNLIKTKCKSNRSLLSMLPKPKNASTFGPTLKLDSLLQLPDRADDAQNDAAIKARLEESEAGQFGQIGQDGMIEVDVSKVVSADLNTDSIKELTMEKSRPTVLLPRGKEKQKNQITYLAQLGKANELERKEQAALSHFNKKAARSKYGW